MTSRGCPHSCAYCINHTIKNMYGGKGKLRWRSVTHVITELMWVKKNMPYIDYIWISDDEFMARKLDKLVEFSKKYKEKIGLPFSCLASPLSVSEEKMAVHSCREERRCCRSRRYYRRGAGDSGNYPPHHGTPGHIGHGRRDQRRRVYDR